MPNLLSLPNELLLQIIEETFPEGIESFSRCCRTIYNLSGKTLKQHQLHKARYSVLAFTEDLTGGRELSSEPYAISQHSSPVRDPFQFLCDIINDRRIAHYPSKLELRYWRRRKFPKYPANVLGEVIPEVLGSFSEASKSSISSFEFGEGWQEAFEGNRNAMLAGLLPLLPNLKILRIHEGNADTFAMVKSLCRAWPFSTFDTLTELYVVGDSPDLVEILFHLSDCKSLRTLELTWFLFGDFRDCKPYPRFSSSIRNLRFIDCALDIRSLVQVIENSEVLEKFVCQFMYFVTELNEPLIPRQITNAL